MSWEVQVEQVWVYPGERVGYLDQGPVWDPAPPCEQRERDTQLKTLSSRNFFDGLQKEVIMTIVSEKSVNVLRLDSSYIIQTLFIL